MWPSSFDAASGFDVAQQFRCYTAANTNHVHGEVSQRSNQPRQKAERSGAFWRRLDLNVRLLCCNDYKNLSQYSISY
jgi:hypothetical protein